MSIVDLLPLRFKNSKEVTEFENAVDRFVSKAEAEKDSFFNQLNVDTATWGLELWEKEYGLETDITKTLLDRRSRIKSKMRGTGTSTKKLIQNIAESFSNGYVEVTEHNDEYYFEIEFVGKIGLPPNIPDIKAAIEEAKPAHLNVVYICKYRMHKDLKAYTYGNLKAYNHKEIRTRQDLNI